MTQQEKIQFSIDQAVRVIPNYIAQDRSASANTDLYNRIGSNCKDTDEGAIDYYIDNVVRPQTLKKYHNDQEIEFIVREIRSNCLKELAKMSS